MASQTQGTDAIDGKSSAARLLLRAKERASLQQTYNSDPKYKKYAQQVEKCLASFDSVHEWADFIAFLKQLLKTLQAYLQFKEIPRKLIVAKRLAQCLNPALPTGVHQRALDVYSHIFGIIGSEGLRRDLFLWTSGLFPFFEYAATSVKPALLHVYDVYMLPLQSSLRPVMKAFIISLLPGLEEETGEFFDQVLSLLDRLSGTISPSFFLQNVWLVMLTSPPARGTALNFLSRRLPKLNPEEDITPIVGEDIGLMIRAFAAALEDENLLVRRGALELLLTTLRLDSAAVREASAEDRTILMRAATSVVMRRDLSLNRRLYSWLLGPDEVPEQQTAYLHAHGLKLLSSTLRNEMNSPSSEYSQSRPYKIFISLLDKWEIGGPLTDVLVLDAFQSLKTSIESDSDAKEELALTASTLYEAVEPQVIWKHLLAGIVAELTADDAGSRIIRLARYLLTSTFVRDAEVQSAHLPLVFSAVVEVLRDQVVLRRVDMARTSIQELMPLLSIMAERSTAAALATALETPSRNDNVALGPYSTACMFYGLKPGCTLQDSGARSNVPAATILEDLSLVASISARITTRTTRSIPVRALALMLDLLQIFAGQKIALSVTLEWTPDEWLADMLSAVEGENATFVEIDRVISLIIAMQETPGLKPAVSLRPRHTVFRLVNLLLRYLRPEYSAYHQRCVSLIWSLDSCTNGRHIESIIAQALTSPESRSNDGAYEAFGIFWRLTEDDLLPGFRFKIPLMIVLDTLKSGDPNLRRIGETWMRCSLKSYLRVLDPLLYDLLDPALHRLPSVAKVNGKELQDFEYERPIDQSYLKYVLETLLSVVRFGGQGFGKTARTTPVRKCHHPGVLERVEAAGLNQEVTYQDVLVDVLTRFLQSECKSKRVRTMAPGNLVLQATAVDLLQALVSRGEVDVIALEVLEAAVIGKLYVCAHTQRLELQNKLLHLLHSVISAAHTVHYSRHRAAPSVSSLPAGHEPPTEAQSSYSVNPLLVQTLIDGVSLVSNRPTLQHWLDFILMTVPQFPQSMQAALAPLSDCVGRQLSACMEEMRSAAGVETDSLEDVRSTTTDADFLMLLNALERLILLNLQNIDPGPVDEEDLGPQKPVGVEGSSGILGIMTNVFASDSPPSALDEQLTTRSPGYRALNDGIRVLFSLWTTLNWNESGAWTPQNESLSMIFSKTRARCRRAFEHLFRLHSAEVLECVIECWSRETPAPSSTTFQLVDILTSSAQNLVHMVCESISCRTPGLADKHRRGAVNPNLSDATLFQFLEQYLQQLEGPLALQVWGRFLQLARDILANVKDSRSQIFPTLRCFSVLASKLTRTTAIEDRRLRKDLQDVYAKLLDAVLLSVNRGADQSFWSRRGLKDGAINGRDSPAPRSLVEIKVDEKNASSTSLASPVSSDTSETIIQFMSSDALPHLRQYLIDNDKILVACTNIMYYIVSPAIKGKSRALDVDVSVLQIIREMSQLSSALKVWRGVVSEIVNDARFFSCSPESEAPFRPIVQAWLKADKSAFAEVTGKITTVSSTNIFTNREYENMLRSVSIRRMSYLLSCGEKNEFMTSLPTIQEKLVDIFKNVTAPSVLAEVFLCIRVLLCRLSPRNLTSFWPVIMSETYRLITQTMTDLPMDGSEGLPLLLSVSKFLDLLLVLQTEEFQVHEWAFITDTVDAVYHPDDWLPEALLDQLAEIAGQLPAAETQPPSTGTALHFPIATPSIGYRPLRRPMLTNVKTIDSVRDLVSFFSSASIASYESIYASGGNIDWAEVERGLNLDIFDGR